MSHFFLLQAFLLLDSTVMENTNDIYVVYFMIIQFLVPCAAAVVSRSPDFAAFSGKVAELSTLEASGAKAGVTRAPDAALAGAGKGYADVGTSKVSEMKMIGLIFFLH